MLVLQQLRTKAARALTVCFPVSLHRVVVVVVQIKIKRVQQAAAAVAQQITAVLLLLEALRHRQRKAKQAVQRLVRDLAQAAVVALALLVVKAR